MTDLLAQPEPTGAPTPTLPAAPDSVVRFDPSQRRLFLDESRVIVVNWHRQKGKDFTTAAKAVDEAMRTGQNWYIIALTQAQADETFAKVVKVAKTYASLLGRLVTQDSPEYVEYDKWIKHHFTFKARELILPNGAKVVSCPGRDPDSLAGRTGNIILTEFGLFPGGGYEHWDVLFPIITRGNFRLMAISTPRGKQTKFYEIFSDPEQYSVHLCDIHRSVAEDGYQLYDGKGRPCDVATFQRLYNSPSKWPREYECQFTGDLSSLIKWAQLEAAAALSAGLAFDYLRVEGESGWDPNFFKRNLGGGDRLEIGWDVARRRDLSAVPVNVRRTGRPTHLRFLVLMHNASFALQRQVLRAAMDQSWANIGCGDATGMGTESNEWLEAAYRDRWQGVNFTSSSKREIASALVTAFSDRSQTLPAMEGPYKFVATDLYAIQKDDTTEKMTLDETDNPLMPESHCDIAWGLGLARIAAVRHPEMPLPRPLARKPAGW